MLPGSEIDEDERYLCRSWLGIGPRFAIGSLLYAGAVGVLHWMYPDAMTLAIIPRPLAWVGGAFLLVAGAAVYITSIIQLRSSFVNGQLHTTGIYGRVRHPIYASFILLIVPGLVVIARSIPGITIPFVMYGLFRAFIGEEERKLLATFGEEYRKYRRRVRALIPRASKVQKWMSSDD